MMSVVVMVIVMSIFNNFVMIVVMVTISVVDNFDVVVMMIVVVIVVMSKVAFDNLGLVVLNDVVFVIGAVRRVVTVVATMTSPSGFVGAPLASKFLEEAPLGFGFSLSLEHELGFELSLAGLGNCDKSSKSESLGEHYESFYEVLIVAEFQAYLYVSCPNCNQLKYLMV